MFLPPCPRTGASTPTTSWLNNHWDWVWRCSLVNLSVMSPVSKTQINLVGVGFWLNIILCMVRLSKSCPGCKSNGEPGSSKLKFDNIYRYVMLELLLISNFCWQIPESIESRGINSRKFHCFQQEDWVRFAVRLAQRSHPKTMELSILQGAYLFMRFNEGASSSSDDGGIW